MALSDIASNRSEHSPSRHHHSSTTPHHHSYLSSQLDQDDLSRHESNDSSRPEAIQEVSEPTSPESSHSSQASRGQSALTELIRNSPPTEEESQGTDEEELPTTAGVHPVTVQGGIFSHSGEQTRLLVTRTAYGSIKDLEGQRSARAGPTNQMRAVMQQSKEQTTRIIRVASNPKSWNRRYIWEFVVLQAALLVPAVILGLLLNILDAMSYGEPQLTK